jgi:hypothetical protein
MSDAVISPGDNDPRHGTANGYSNLDCRCVPCRDAWAAYYLTFRNRARELAPDDSRHGTSNGYRYWHCRCRPCTDASARERREHVARARRVAARPDSQRVPS